MQNDIPVTIIRSVYGMAIQALKLDVTIDELFNYVLTGYNPKNIDTPRENLVTEIQVGFYQIFRTFGALIDDEKLDKIQEEQKLDENFKMPRGVAIFMTNSLSILLNTGCTLARHDNPTPIQKGIPLQLATYEEWAPAWLNKMGYRVDLINTDQQ